MDPDRIQRKFKEAPSICSNTEKRMEGAMFMVALAKLAIGDSKIDVILLVDDEDEFDFERWLVSFLLEHLNELELSTN